jgi:hypothetical protein
MHACSRFWAERAKENGVRAVSGGCEGEKIRNIWSGKFGEKMVRRVREWALIDEK